jgi:ribonucleoside-diphosphate reductase alpha chain
MATAPEQLGIGIRRHFTKPGVHPYDTVEWERRDARIPNFKDGGDAFFQPGVEFPTTWSLNATNIVAQKYFRGTLGTPEREWSLRQVIDRVADTITDWGVRDGYFVDDEEAETFRAELKHVLVHQRAAFNSPVWFNIGVKGVPQQASACQPFDALVATPGGMVPIGRIVEERLVGMKVFDAHGITRVIGVKHNGRKEVLRVHTKAGITLDVTPDHLVWRLRRGERSGWSPAADLRPGDQLEWHRGESWGHGEISTREMAEAALAGWLQSDGFVGQHDGTNRSLTIEAMTVTPDEHSWVTWALDAVFPDVRRHERHVVTRDESLECRRIRLYGGQLRAFVERWGLLTRGVDMTVPEELFTAPLPVVAAYLRSVFQAEGYVALRDRSALVGLDMVSERLVRGLQQLLMRFGIYSRVRRKDDPRPNRLGTWSLSIRAAGDRLRFGDEIGFVCDRKAARLEATFALPGVADVPVKRLEVERVQSLGEMDVYDIQTESGEYLSNHLRVHNCFILAVEDTMDGILNWYREEGIIFKGGSGSGINLSTIRSSHEALKGGGTASGPVSFMRGADASAGTIKCLHADTPIVTDRGVAPIRDVVAGSRVLTRFGEATVSAVHDNGVRPLVRLRTSLGDELLCTPEHRFLVRGPGGEVWKRAGELLPDDFLLLDVSARQTGVSKPLEPVACEHHNEVDHDLPTQLDETFALWLGWVYGDGSVTRRPSAAFVSVQIGDGDPELAGRYEAVSRAVFGPRLHLYRSRRAGRDASVGVRFASTQIVRFLERNGLRKGRADELRMPAAVMASPLAVRAAFLSGLFEADGHVGNGYPWLSTVSAEFARDVHRLLASCGIPSRIGRIDDRRAAHGHRPVHTVRVIGGEGVWRFAKLVGFVSERKQAALEAAVTRKQQARFETQWFLPHVVGELRAIWERRADQALRRAIAPYCRYAAPRRMSLLRARALLERFPEALGGTTLARFALGDVVYVSATVEPAGAGPTFDLTVDEVHEYLVHGLVTHNSGGKTRRAAKMVVLNADHPDIEEFIWCKAIEERKARALRDAGFDMDLDGRDSHSIQYQNANNSVRVTDEFMQAVIDDGDWELRAVTTGDVLKRMKARDLMRQISQSAWECADPGMQFDTTINRWHTASNTGRINASNPCSEYVHLDNSACNLASINLLKYLDEEGRFDVDGFRHTVEVVFTAQEILVGNADYPTERIAETSRAFRQLGLGYANLGALLMAEGMPYDSDAGRAWAAAITSLMTGHAYATSARTAARMGPFAGYAVNEKPMLGVLRMHREAATKIDDSLVPAELLGAARHAWDEAVELGERYGVRNSQASVLAPTGCLVGGTLVPTEHGLVRLGSLGDVAGEQWQPLETRVRTDDGVRTATQFYVNGVEPVVRVQTRRGYQLRGTVKHRVKVVDAAGDWVWRRLGDLQAGDRVPLLRGGLVGEPQVVALPPLGEHMGWAKERSVRVPETMTPELAEFVGYFMGDGSLHSKGLRLCVTADDFDVVEHLKLTTKSLFGVDARVSDQDGYVSVEVHSVRLAEWWQACGFAKQRPHAEHSGKGYRPHVPDAVLWSNDAAVYRAFLRGLFEADGTVTAGYPSWTTTCLDFSHDVQTLMLALGFVTTRHFGTSGRGSRLAILRLLNQRSNDRWLDDIGFLSARKAAAVHTGDCPQAARHDHIPVTRALIDRVVPENGRNRKVALMALRRDGAVSRRLAEQLYAASGDAELRHLLEFFFDIVETAELAGEELTYDLSVPDNVTYVANGFVSHNTIGLMMDCDTTGIEPDLALTKAKKLVGGGTMFIVNQTVPRALRKLGYTDDAVARIVGYIDEHKTIIGAPGFNPEHLPVFACSMGDNPIHFMGHVKMMGAVQPFISGAISKTVNMPEDVTVEDVENLHIEAWQLGLKAVAIYRDNCKVAQPLSTQKKSAEVVDAAGREVERIVETVIVQEPVRQKLPRKRVAKTFSFRVADCHGYVTVGEYEDGRPGEIFLQVAKQGSTLAGIMDAFAISVSHGLQYGVPLEAFVEMFTNMRFEPAGMTDDPDIRFASSLVDYIFRRLAVEYLPYDKREAMGILTVGERSQPTLPGVEEATTPVAPSIDLPPEDRAPSAGVTPPSAPPASPAPHVQQREVVLCHVCGDMMQRAGSCYACPSCGSTSGCS